MCVIYQNICFGRNCLYVANVTEFIAAENGPGQERLAKLLFFLSIACENIRFSSLFAAGDVSRGGTSPTQWQKFLTDDVKICPESGHKSWWQIDGSGTNFNCCASFSNGYVDCRWPAPLRRKCLGNRARGLLAIWPQVAQAHYESPEQHYPT